VPDITIQFHVSAPAEHLWILTAFCRSIKHPASPYDHHLSAHWQSIHVTSSFREPNPSPTQVPPSVPYWTHPAIDMRL
jgi:hypothetical protein